ncbi:hypothetical protein KAW18_04310 [candidate division WOR-3 bacterium]|nr:hypothetical protein [candidate division WOR-3 bacterium]
MNGKVLVVGLGEIGSPLKKILEKTYEVMGLDIKPKEIKENISIMHICYPYKEDNFISTTKDYIARFNPDLTIINSTLLPGTIRSIHKKTGVPLAYSPIRGKHKKMERDLLYYTKFVAGVDEKTTNKAIKHFESAGLKTKKINSLEGLELAKLLSTSYFGVLIAWAQETERFCRKLDVNYDEVMSFTEEIDYFPSVIFQPGYIGGHCVIPNIHILKNVKKSEFLTAILKSNEQKKKDMLKKGLSLTKRNLPKPKNKQ